MRKKSLLLILTVAASLAVLAGCGNTNTAEDGGNIAAAATEEEVVTTEVTPVAEEAEPVEVEEEETVAEAKEEAIPDFMPSSFVEIQAMKETFDSFDELISYLEPGQGYAYCNIFGRDDEVLIICENTYEYEDGKMAAIDGSLYVNENGVIKNMGNMFSEGTAYPISLDSEGYIFTGGNHRMEVGCASAEYGGYMILKSAHEEFDEQKKDADGNPVAIYSGFVRSSNTLSEDGEDIAEDDASVITGLFDEFNNNTTPIFFTVAE